MERWWHVFKKLIWDSIWSRGFSALECAECSGEGMLAKDIGKKVMVSLFGSGVKSRSECEGVRLVRGGKRIGVIKMKRSVSS